MDAGAKDSFALKNKIAALTKVLFFLKVSCVTINTIVIVQMALPVRITIADHGRQTPLEV